MHCQVLHEYHRYEGQFIPVLSLVTGFHLEGQGHSPPCHQTNPISQKSQHSTFATLTCF